MAEERSIETMQKQLDQGICPVCQTKHGKKVPRQSVQSHLRMSTEKAHVLWRDVWYRALCPHGRYREKPVAKPLEVAAFAERLKRAVGEDALTDIVRYIQTSA